MSTRRPQHQRRRAARQPFAGAGHDHARCVREALDAAERLCRDRGERLTALRRRVLELIWNSHRPVGAYELLDMLRGERGRVAPPTVYRALDFLQAQGLVHRVESLNAFKGCEQPEAPHQAHLLICRRCGLAAEVADDGLDGAIAALARRSTFEVEAETVELTGLCADCRGG